MDTLFLAGHIHQFHFSIHRAPVIKYSLALYDFNEKREIFEKKFIKKIYINDLMKEKFTKSWNFQIRTAFHFEFCIVPSATVI